MTVRNAPPALTVMRDYESGAKEAHWAESRRAMSGGTLSARCKRLEENMLLNLSTLQTHRRGLEDVVQKRKDQAKENIKKMMEEIEESRGAGRSGPQRGSMLGIAPLNFSTMKERASALEEKVYENQDILNHNRGVLDEVLAAKREETPNTTARTEHPDEVTLLEGVRSDAAGGAAQGLVVDRCRIIEENARMMTAPFQAQGEASAHDEDLTKLYFEDIKVAEEKAATEARQYILFGIKPASPGNSRPASAPAGARSTTPGTRPSSSTSTYGRPSSSASNARPQSGISYGRPVSSTGAYSTRPQSAAAGRPVRPSSSMSQRSGGVLGVPSRPCSANSMRARMKVLEENVARNKTILTTNRDGIEVVKKRRQQAAEAMTQLLIDMKPVGDD